MHDRKSLYSRNKRNSRAILCPDAFEQDHPLTPEQFSSEEEFRFWKTWSDEDYHNWELAVPPHPDVLRGHDVPGNCGEGRRGFPKCMQVHYGRILKFSRKQGDK